MLLAVLLAGGSSRAMLASARSLVGTGQQFGIGALVVLIRPYEERPHHEERFWIFKMIA